MPPPVLFQAGSVLPQSMLHRNKNLRRFEPDYWLRLIAVARAPGRSTA